MKYIRYRFKTKAIDDYRPLIDMKDIQCPYCNGTGYEGTITKIDKNKR